MEYLNIRRTQNKQTVVLLVINTIACRIHLRYATLSDKNLQTSEQSPSSRGQLSHFRMGDEQASWQSHWIHLVKVKQQIEIICCINLHKLHSARCSYNINKANYKAQCDTLRIHVGKIK